MAKSKTYHTLGLQIVIEKMTHESLGKGVYIDFSGTPNDPGYPVEGTANRFKALFHFATGQEPRKIENPQGSMDCLFIAETPGRPLGQLYRIVAETLESLAALEASGHHFPLTAIIAGYGETKSTTPPASDSPVSMWSKPAPPRDVNDVDDDRLHLPPRQNDADDLRAAVMDGINGVVSAREKMIDEDLQRTSAEKGAKIKDMDSVRKALVGKITDAVLFPSHYFGATNFLARSDTLASVKKISARITPVIEEKLTGEEGKKAYYIGEFAEAACHAINEFKEGRDSSRSR